MCSYPHEPRDDRRVKPSTGWESCRRHRRRVTGVRAKPAAVDFPQVNNPEIHRVTDSKNKCRVDVDVHQLIYVGYSKKLEPQGRNCSIRFDWNDGLSGPTPTRAGFLDGTAKAALAFGHDQICTPPRSEEHTSELQSRQYLV